MAVLRASNGREIRTYAGVQLAQYRDQMNAAGMLDPIKRATGAERRRLVLAASHLAYFLRRGIVSPESKAAAEKLGLKHYPDGAERSIER